MNLRTAAKPALLGFCYLLVLALSSWVLRFDGIYQGGGPWLPAGLSLALLCLGGLPFLPLVLVAHLGLCFWLMPDSLGWFRIVWPILTTSIYGLCAVALKRSLGGAFEITRLRELGILMLAALAFPLLAATAGSWLIKASALGSSILAPELFGRVFFTHCLGILTVTPPCLVLLRPLFFPPADQEVPWVPDQLQHHAENVAQIIAVALVVLVASLSGDSGWVHLVALLPLLWIGLRHGLGEASMAATFVVLAIHLLQGQGDLGLQAELHHCVLVLIALSVGTVGTSHRRLLLKMKDRQSLLTGVLKGSSLGLWQWSPGSETSFDQQWCALLGYELSEAPQNDLAWRRLIHKDDLSHVLWLRDAHWKGHAPTYEAEYRLLAKDQTYRWVLDRGLIVRRDGFGKPATMAGTTFDLSVRKEAETRLQKLLVLVDESSDYIGAADGQGNIVYANLALQRLRNDTDLRAASSRHISEYFTEVMARKVLSEGLPYSFSQGLWSSEVELADVSGRVIPVSLVIQVHKDPASGLFVYFFIARDITRCLKIQAAQVATLKQELQAQKYESLSALAGGVAHDFNNLLTAIIGNLGLASLDLPTDSPLRNFLRQIEAASQRAAELCQSLQLYAGKGQGRLIVADLNAVVTNALPSLRQLAGVRVHLETKLETALPSLGADPQKIDTALRVLVQNAIDAFGNKAGTIYLSTRKEEVRPEDLRSPYQFNELKAGTYLVLEVRDEGMGMHPATLSRLFEPFFSTKQAQQGMGLAVLLGIAVAHSGAVHVDSEPGKGSCFKLYFPILTAELPPNPKTSTAVVDWRSAGQILVIDDEESVRVVSTYMLESLGFTPLVARDGAEGLRIFRQHAASLRTVLLDLTMPHMDGEQTYAEIRRISAHVPILVMSGYSEKEMEGRFKHSDPAGFLHKPFNVNDLRSLLYRVLVTRP